MKVLITGAYGFIAGHLANELAKRGHSIILLDQEATKRPATLVQTAEEMLADITDLEVTKEAFHSAKANIIFHLAAVTGIQNCLANEELGLKTNILGTYNVMRASAESGASKIVFASSREVYGETGDRPTREDDQAKPNNLYGLTKVIGEEVIKWGCMTHGLRYTILRISNAYGPGGEKYGIHKILANIVSGGDVTVMGGTQLMNFIYIDDLTAAFCKALEEPLSDNQVFNIAGPDTMTLQDTISLICNLMGKKVNLRIAPMRVTETVRFIPDISKARELLGWSPQVKLHDGIRQILSSS